MQNRLKITKSNTEQYKYQKNNKSNKKVITLLDFI